MGRIWVVFTAFGGLVALLKNCFPAAEKERRGGAADASASNGITIESRDAEEARQVGENALCLLGTA